MTTNRSTPEQNQNHNQQPRGCACDPCRCAPCACGAAPASSTASGCAPRCGCGTKK